MTTLRKIVGGLCLSLLVIGVPVLAQDATAKTTWICPADVVALVQSLPENDRVLNWWNWTTYEADNTRADFGALCGVTVNEDNFANNEEVIAKLQQGNPGYDLIVPTSSSVEHLIDLGLVQPIDLSKIPNFANVSESLVDPVYDKGNKYTIPYQWGTLGIGYNKEVVGKEVTSWEDMWDFKGNVAWVDDPQGMLAIALNLIGKDPNSKNPDDVTAARDYLIDRGGNVRALAADDGQEKLLSGEMDMVVEYSGDIFQIIANCDENPDQKCAGKFDFVLPKEGTLRWVDNLAIPAGAPHYELALACMDYILDPQVGADISNYTAYATPNQKAIEDELILPEYLESPIIYPTAESSKSLFPALYVGEEATRMYNDAWIELRTLLGQ